MGTKKAKGRKSCGWLPYLELVDPSILGYFVEQPGGARLGLSCIAAIVGYRASIDRGSLVVVSVDFEGLEASVGAGSR